MPISDEVIELVPAGKSKSKVIIFIVAAAVGIALAVTFLILFLLKPSVEDPSNAVTDVAVSSTELFTVPDENGEPVSYVSVGNTYTVSANIVVEGDAGTGIEWEVMPRGAVVEVSAPAAQTVPDSGASFTFKPNYGFHNTEVTLTARSIYDRTKYKTIKFTVVDQGAESIVFDKYYPRGESNSPTSIPSDQTIRIPYYPNSTSSSINKTYQMEFTQRGKYNSSTGTYLPVSDIKIKKDGNDVALNGVTVVSSDKTIVDVTDFNESRFTFKAGRQGDATITVTANVNNDSAENFSASIKVKVQSNEELGYVDEIYVFSQPIVTAEFIESVLDNTRNNVVKSKIDAELERLNVDEDGKKLADADPRKIAYNTDITLPYRISYENIFSHVLVTPVSIMYDKGEKVSDGKLKENWYTNMEVTSSNRNAVSITTQNNKTVLATNALASTVNADGVNSCKLTFTDGKSGSVRSSRTVNINVVAKNNEGSVSAKVGNQTFAGTESNKVQVVPGSESTLDITYNSLVMGHFEDKDTSKLIEYGYMSKKVYFDFDPDYVTIVRSGADTELEPGKIYELQPDSMTFGAASNQQTTAHRDGTVRFIVTTKAGLEDGQDFTITYYKLGSFSAEDAGWSKTVYYNVNKVATEAEFITDKDKIEAIVTRNGTAAGRFVPETATSATLYVQNRAASNTTPFIDLYKFTDLITANGSFTTSVGPYSIQSTGVFINTQSLYFTGQSRPMTATSADATVEVTVRSGSKEIGKFTIKIQVIDAITQFDKIENKTAEYSGSDFADSSIEIKSSEITVKRALVQASAAYTRATVYLSYKSGADDVYFERVPDGEKVYFRYDGKDVYVYENNRLKPLVDLYAFASGNNKLPFHDVKLYFKLPNDEYYYDTQTEGVFVDEDGKPYGVAYCTFNRKADGVVVATDSNFENKLALNVSDDNKIYYNMGAPVELYVSAVINVNGASVIAEINGIGGYLPAYIEVDNDKYRPNGREYEGATQITGKKYYREVKFNAPTIAGEEVEEGHTFSLYYGTNATRFSDELKFTVQNKSRAIASIEIYTDENCTVKATENDFVFGSFIGKDNVYIKTVYIKLTYVDYNSNQLSLETATLVLPHFLTAEIGESIGSEITLTPSINVDTENAEEKFTCVIMLTNNAVRGSGDIIVRQSSMPNNNGVKAVLGATADTGLSGITLEEETHSHGTDESRTMNIDVTAALDGTRLNDIQNSDMIFKFAVKYNALTHNDYAGIEYNMSGDCLAVDYSGMTGGNLPAITGLSFINNLRSTEGGMSALKIDPNNVRTLDDTFVIKFTDTAGGANSNNVFTINIHVTVTVDIFALNVDINDDKFIVETQNIGVDRKQSFSAVYNNGNPDLQPGFDKKQLVDVFVVRDGERLGDSADFKIEKTVNSDNKTVSYALVVNDAVLNASGIAVRLQYKDFTKDIPVVIKSRAHYLDFASDTIDMNKVADGLYSAQVTVTDEPNGNVFAIGAVVKNSGTNDIAEDKASAIKYAVYTNEDCTDLADNIATYVNGVVTITPSAAKGVLYCRATYTDVGGTGIVNTLTVAVTYYVKITDVTIDADEISDVLIGNNIYLYRANDNVYTQIDLAGHITAVNGFGKAFGDELEIVISSATANPVDVNGTVIYPRNLSADGVTLTVTARYKGVQSAIAESTSYSNSTYKVIVRGLTAPTLDKNEGSVDISTSSTDSVAVNFNAINGFNGVFEFRNVASGIGVTKVEGENRFVLSADHTVDAGRKYTLNGYLLYTLNDGASATVVSDLSVDEKKALYVPVTYGLTVTCDRYVPEFKLVATVDGVETEIESGTPYTVTSGATYKLVLTNKANDVVYSAKEANALFTFGEESGGVIPFTLDDKMSGAANVTVTAVMLDKYTFTNTATYSFNYGLNVTSQLKIFDADSNGFIEFTGDSQAIDFTTDKVKFRLQLDNVDMSAARLELSVSGGTVTRYDNADYADIVVDKPGMLVVGGYIELGGRTIYLDTYTVELTATAPEFEFDGVADEVNPGDEIALNVRIGNTAKGFKGDIKDINYSIVVGSERASFKQGSDNIIVINNDISIDCVITVRAVVTVSNGVFANKEYTIGKEITINGYAKPVVSWNDGITYSVVNDGSRVFDYTIRNGEWLDSDDYSIEINTVNTSLISGTDFTFDKATRTLTINRTASTKAGGKLTLRAVLTINDKVHNGYSSTAEITVVVLPSIDTSPITIGNAAATIDIANNITVYDRGANDGFIKNSDVVVKSLTFKSGVDYNNLFAINGTKLTLVSNVTTSGSFKFGVEVAVVTGAYAGSVMNGEITVTVNVPPAIDAITAVWNSSDNAYRYNPITVPDGVNGMTDVTAVGVRAVGNGAEFVTIDNGVISIDKDAHTYLAGDSSADKNPLAVTLEYSITANGRLYYAEGVLNIPAVEIAVTAIDDGGNDPQDGLDKYVNDAFNVTLNATNGFAVIIDRIEITKPSTDAENMSYSFGGNKAIFATPSVANGGTYNISVTYSAGGISDIVISFAVAVKAPTSTSAYTATNTDITDMVVGQSRRVVSEWNYNKNSDSQYRYAVSVSVSSPDGALSKYFGSIKLYTSDPDTGSAEATATLTSTTATLNFAKSSSGYGGSYKEVTKFWLVMEFNTDSAIAKCPITVSFRAANRSSSYSAQTQNITMTYNVQVVNRYTVTLNANGGSVSDGAIIVTNGGKYGILPTPTRNLYEFAGWYTQAEGGSQITKDSDVNLSQNQILYAHWTAVSNDITLITYGGTISGSASASVKAGEKYVVPANTQVTRTGYEFGGWYTEENGGGRNITTNTTADIDSVYTVLYAKWTAKRIKVTLDADGGAGSPAYITVNYNAAYGTINDPIKTGYTFGGWFTEANGNGSRVYSNTVMLSETDVTLHAYWIKDTYTVTLSLGYVGGKDIVFKAVSGEFAMHSQIKPERDGYEFIGWYNAADNGSKVADTLEISTDTTLYAQWKQVYTVSFDLNGANGSVAVKQYYDGDKYGELPTLSRDGYELVGWSKTADGSVVLSNDSFDKTSLTLYAIWKKITYSVKLHLNDGSENDVIAEFADVSGDFGIHTLINPARDGYEFLGWYDSKENGTKVEDTLDITENTELFAQWRQVGGDSGNDQSGLGE